MAEVKPENIVWKFTFIFQAPGEQALKNEFLFKRKDSHKAVLELTKKMFGEFLYEKCVSHELEPQIIIEEDEVPEILEEALKMFTDKFGNNEN